MVALHPEGVDRNKYVAVPELHKESPSTRRAWIEIPFCAPLQMEGRSPSTRRAWIEIETNAATSASDAVALHPEGVDRNSIIG